VEAEKSGDGREVGRDPGWGKLVTVAISDSGFGPLFAGQQDNFMRVCNLLLSNDLQEPIETGDVDRIRTAT
jgi:hypothetical protein